MSIVRRLGVMGAAVAAGAIGGFAQNASAQTAIEHAYEHRFQLDLRVPDAALAKLLPAGWEPNIATQGPAKDTNIRLIFIDRYDITAPDGKPKGANRIAQLAVPVKQTGTQTVGQMIIGGISEDAADATAPAGTYVKATVAKMQRSYTSTGGQIVGEENWEFEAASGERFAVHVKYQPVAAARNATPSETRFFSAANPSQFLIVKAEQGLDIMQNVPVPVSGDRVKEFSLKASGGKFAGLFDGSEKVMSWDHIPWATRTTLQP